ncbi:MAG: 2-hydroxyglutaryl-CoA dehydratase [Deltaproteobacteria bacterium]|nr:2-hydroxyglutaryl-CoA dehydratase [Deltaproteobacteria bacterium]
MSDAAKAVALGVDAGSTTWKAVAIDATGAIVASLVEPAEPRIGAQTERAVAVLRTQAGADAAVPLGATGYGRKRVAAARSLTEITCHARGAFARMRRPGVLIDVGGQDTKVIRIGAAGDVADFSMNDKCAAGTGRFLEVILGRLHVPLGEVAAFAARAERSVLVSSTCTVFAESEVVSLVAEGQPVEGIVKGLHAALASRVAALAGTMPQDGGVFMSGGVALNPAMVEALAGALGRRVEIVPDPQLVGALGAALAVRP